MNSVFLWSRVYVVCVEFLHRTPQTQCNLLHRFREIGHKHTPKENSLYSTAVRGEPEHTDKQDRRGRTVPKATVVTVQNILELFTCCYCSHIVFRMTRLGLSGKRSIAT